jgi:hypothetical protein
MRDHALVENLPESLDFGSDRVFLRSASCGTSCLSAVCEKDVLGRKRAYRLFAKRKAKRGKASR